MPITITKPGTPPTDQRYVAACGNCGLELQCSQTDLGVKSVGDQLTVYIGCPVCKTQLTPKRLSK